MNPTEEEGQVKALCSSHGAAIGILVSRVDGHDRELGEVKGDLNHISREVQENEKTAGAHREQLAEWRGGIAAQVRMAAAIGAIVGGLIGGLLLWLLKGG